MASKTVLDCMKRYDRQMAQDTKDKKTWVYANTRTSGTFDAAVRDKNRRANCATIANWALKQLKVIKSGMYLYSAGNSTIAWSKETQAAVKKQCKVISLKGISSSQAIKQGKIQAGDIILHVGQHTNVYAGDDIWYDSGHFNCTPMTGEEVPFTHRWRCHKPGDASSLAYAIRYNGNPQIQKIFRVQFRAVRTENAAKRVIKECKEKSGQKTFYELMNDNLYHCFAGKNYKSLANAKKQAALIQKWYPTAWVKEITIKTK